MSIRKLVTFRTVTDIIPIPDADNIVLAQIDGWQCVVRKGEFSIGDRGIFFEIDSILPEADERFKFLAARRFRIKSMKLKKVLSQGLLMPMSILTHDEHAQISMAADDGTETDLTTLFKVVKYEPALPIGGKQKGTFPTHLVPKTAQERIQNIPQSSLDQMLPMDFNITEKLDGTSCTIWAKKNVEDGTMVVGVASRNWEMQPDDDSVYSKVLRGYNLTEKLTKLGKNIALQGEIVGPSIQGNKYGLAQQTFFLFDVWDIDRQEYLPDSVDWAKMLELNHVPEVTVPSYVVFNRANLLTEAEGPSQLNSGVMREGLVFKHKYEKHNNTRFKVISNAWLLKHEK